MYLTHTLEIWFKEASRQFPVLRVTGARQVGKTTFLRRVSEPERTDVTLDDPLVLALAKSDPALFMQRFLPPALIDEIQYAPELLPYIKMVCDQRRSPNLFWLTGSQQFQMMRGVSESLAGRVGVLQLLGFSCRELLGRGETATPFLPLPEATETGSPLDLMELYRLIWRGLS
jgi:predicted AAA+ superfamily ATPase